MPSSSNVSLSSRYRLRRGRSVAASAPAGFCLMSAAGCAAPPRRRAACPAGWPSASTTSPVPIRRRAGRGYRGAACPAVPRRPVNSCCSSSKAAFSLIAAGVLVRLTQPGRMRAAWSPARRCPAGAAPARTCAPGSGTAARRPPRPRLGAGPQADRDVGQAGQDAVRGDRDVQHFHAAAGNGP